MLKMEQRVYLSLLDYLRCPDCRGRLRPTLYEIDRQGEVLRAELACLSCAACYPVCDGIVDFLGVAKPQTQAQTVNELALTAWSYERLWRPFALTLLSSTAFPYRRELPLIVAMAAPLDSGLFLDLACSNGLYARALARAAGGASITIAGIDHARPMLVEARRRARAARLEISYIRAEAQRLPFADGAASSVLIGGSLNEIGDSEQCLAEIGRTLMPEGRFVAMTLVQARNWIGRALQHALRIGGISFWPPDALVALFARHGITTTHRQQHGVVLFTRGV